MKRVVRGVGVLLVLLLGVVGVTLLKRQPSASRDWAVDQAIAARAQITGSAVTIHDVRNFSYPAGTDPVPGYYDATYQLDSLDTAWFVLTTFSKRWRAPAHTFVSFGFSDGRYLAISIEARRQVGQSYGIVAGMLRSFELIYVVGDERDLIGRRAGVEGDATYLYPVRAPKERIRELFVAMLERANRLEQRPEFYNSMFNSCASNLVTHVNALVPGRIPSGLKVMVPGYADEVALSLGLIESDDSLAAVRQRYLINDRARAALGGADFSARIRTATDRR